MAPDSSNPEECEPHSVLTSGVSVISRTMRTLGRGPKAVVEWWVPRALAALPARRLSSLLSEGLPTTTGGGLWVCRGCLGPVTVGTRIRDGGATEEREIGAAGCVS